LKSKNVCLLLWVYLLAFYKTSISGDFVRNLPNFILLLFAKFILIDNLILMKVRCPHCGKVVEWEGNPYRPFCSERCRLIDLGKWLDEEYRIPSEDSSSAMLRQNNSKISEDPKSKASGIITRQNNPREKNQN